MLPFALSPSRAGDFKTCPQLFKYRAVDRLAEPPSLPATKGSVVHLALQRLFRHDPDRRTLQTALELLPQAWEDYVAPEEHSQLFPGGEGFDDALAATERFVRNYFRLEDPSKLDPVGREVRLRATVGKIDVVGVLDRLDRHGDGTWVVSDYKTGRIPGERYAQTSFFACRVYALLVRNLIGELPRRLRLLYLDEPTALVVEPTAAEVSAAGKMLEAMGHALAAALERDQWPARPGSFCQICPHKQICPAHGGMSERGTAA